MNWLVQLRLLADVLAAMILGGLIGFEREAANKPAGLRTHMMVAAAAALMIGIGHALMNEFGVYGTLIRADAFRMISAVVMGVSFLGTGTIMHREHGGSVKGLTTAASLLITATVGLTVGLRLYLIALGVVVLTLVALRTIRHIEEHFELDKAEEASKSSNKALGED